MLLSELLAEDLDHSRRLLFHGTSLTSVGPILATGTLEGRTTDRGQGLAGLPGISLTRSYAYALAHAKGPRSNKVVLVIDATGLKTVPTAYWTASERSEYGKADEMEEFHYGPIRDLRDRLISLNAATRTFDEMVDRLRDAVRSPDARLILRNTLLPAERYLEGGYEADRHLWNRWQPVRGITPER